MYVFFFFQAEDGIRDYKVTGVQTCALPICSRSGDGRVAPPACQLTVSVMVPATVPVCSEKDTGVVLLAGIVKLAVRPPVETWMDGASAGEANDASGWKASVTWPVLSCGYAAPGASVPLNCCAAAAVLDSPLKLADITVSVKAAEAVALMLSVT